MSRAHVAITGASSGIGAALVAEFARAGAAVTMVARRQAEMAALAAQVGGQTQHFVADLRDVAHACDWLGPAQQSFGPIDVLINNAGVQIVEPSVESDQGELEAMIALNLITPMRLTRALLPAMVARRAGTIVDISSVAGLAPTPGMWGYNATKGGLGAASESLRGELRQSGVHVVTVYPGPVDTPLAQRGYAAYPVSPIVRGIPVGRPEVLARLVRVAVERRQARIIYPSFYALTRMFPGITRWFMDRFTPPPYSRLGAAQVPAALPAKGE